MVIGRIIIIILFILFAVFQINDPDPWIWIALYAYIAGMAGLGLFNVRSKPWILLGTLVCLVWMGFLLPDFVKWLRMGMPSILETMKTEKAHIELTREFLGLLLCVISLLLLYRWDRKGSKVGKSAG